MLSKTSQRQIPHDSTYMWHLKNKINEQMKLKETRRHREQMGGRRMVGVSGSWVKEVTGLRGTSWESRSSPGVHSTAQGVRSATSSELGVGPSRRGTPGGALCKVGGCPLCCTPGSNTE